MLERRAHDVAGLSGQPDVVQGEVERAPSPLEVGREDVGNLDGSLAAVRQRADLDQRLARCEAL
jgi:hypothetical protein